jgi:hypothetical protein
VGEHDDLLHWIGIMATAITELLPLSKEFAAPAHECLQLLGTVVDSTMGLMTAPMNAIDGGSRRMLFDNNQTWFSVMC